MKLGIAQNILRKIILDTKDQLSQYIMDNNLSIDIQNADDINLIRSIVQSAGLNDSNLEEEIISEIILILND